MPNEVVANHSGILVPPTYNDVSSLLLDKLGLKMPAANVKVLCEILAAAQRNESNRPNKPSLTKQITELGEAVLKVQEAFVSSPILHWLNKADPGLLARLWDCWGVMDQTHLATEAALLMTPKGRGRGRSATPEEIPPRATCALLVAQLFELSGHEHPNPTDPRAHAIAEKLWLASGGDPWTGHRKNLASWRPYFLKMTRATPDHRQIVRELVRIRLGTKLQAG